MFFRGLCLWRPRMLCKLCEELCWWVREPPLIIWSAPDCRRARGGGALHQTGPGGVSSAQFYLTGLWRLQHTCGLKIDSPPLCVTASADFITIFFPSLYIWVVWFEPHRAGISHQSKNPMQTPRGAEITAIKCFTSRNNETVCGDFKCEHFAWKVTFWCESARKPQHDL